MPVDQYFAFMAECNESNINAKDYQEIYNEFLLYNRKHLLGQPEYDDSVKSVILSNNVITYKNYFEDNKIQYASIENNFLNNQVISTNNFAASSQVTLNACGCASIFALIDANPDLKDPENSGWSEGNCDLPNLADIMYLCQTAFLSRPNANLEDMADINNWDANQILEIYNLGRSHDIFIPCECLAGDNGNPLCDCGSLPGEGFGEVEPVFETPVLPCDSLVKYVDSFVKLNPQLFSAYSKPYPEDVALLIAKYVDSVFSGDPYHRDVVENTTFMTENEYRLERLLGQIELCTGTRGKQGGLCETSNPLFSKVRSYFECTDCKSGNKNAESALLWLRQESKLIKDSITNIPGRLSLMRIDGHNLSTEEVNGYIYTDLYSGFLPLAVDHNYAVSPMSSFINTNKYIVTDGPNTVELFLNFLAPDKKYSSFSNIRGVRFLQPYNFTSCLKENRFVVEVLVEFKSYSDPSKTKMIILPMFGKVINKDLMDTCRATPLLCGKKSTIYAPKVEAPPCGYDFDALINSWADDAYKIYQDSIKEQFVLEYKTHCLNRAKSTEQAKIRFKTQEYHYTLYYYDLAGNLIQTVPPKGVVLANASQITQTSNARKGIASPFYNVHQLKTHYMYNTLNQLKWQVTPDGGVSDFWYDKLGRLIVSRNAKQKAKTKPTYSYTIYDALGRITEVGEVNKSVLNDTMTFQIAYNYDLFLNYVKQGIRTEVTKTFYDNEVYNIAYGDWDQENLRSRVVSTIYQNAGNDNYNLYDHAVHYDYDIHGNVKRMLRDNRSMDSIFQRYKRIDYIYELVSGNVNMVKYQPDSLDQFYHKYSYDADNRIASAYTSRDFIHWDEDAKYKYYLHGPLARTELGELNVQGLDYAYTIQGWIKGVNSERLRPSHDIGKDGFTGDNQWFAKDVFGYGLGYFEGDYQSIGSIPTSTNFTIDRQGSSFQNATDDLFNGNIGWMVTAISKFMGPNDLPFARAFAYDQLNRLISSRVYDNLDATQNKWNSTGSAITAYATDYTYDANGNILTLNRNGKASTPNMDQLTYYYKNNTNQLTYVDDAVSASNYGIDIDDQSSNNYLYDEIGNLIRDASEEIDSIFWTVYGKIWRIKRTAGSTKPDIHFEYSPDGHRVAKHVRDAETKLLTSTWYIRDAQGNVMATYLKTGYLDLDTVNIPHHIITNIVVAENGNDVFANFLAYHMNLPLYMAGTDFTSLKSLLLGAGLMETALRNTSPVDVAINSSITFGQILNTVPTLALFDAMSAYFGSNLAAIQQLCNSPSCKITLAQHMYTADFDAFMPILFQTDFMKAQTVWSTFMAGPIPPNMNLAVSTLKANVNFQLLLRTIVDVFDCNYVLAQYLVYKGPVAFRNQIGTYVDLKNCYRNVFGDYFLANIMDLYDRQLLWTHMFATHPAGFWADILISVNPTEFGRIAFKYFPNEANQLMINANISITDYFSLIESYPALGNAYLSNLKNTLMNMGYTAAGWTYLADEHHIYGSSRVGVHNTNFVLAKRFSTAEMEYTQKAGNQVHFIRGKRNYELSNHLGNVQVVITDKRISVCDNELQTERFEADILMATDYYPFGMAIPERQWFTGSDSSNYRYGFNGQEKDNEVKGVGNSVAYELRIYDSRLGKFFSTDPRENEYSWQSSYVYFRNSPIKIIDYLGGGAKDETSTPVNVESNESTDNEGSLPIQNPSPTATTSPVKDRCPNLESKKKRSIKLNLSWLIKKGRTYERSREWRGGPRAISDVQEPVPGGVLNVVLPIPGGVQPGQVVLLTYNTFVAQDIITLNDQLNNPIFNPNDPAGAGVGGVGNIPIPVGTTSIQLNITPVNPGGASVYNAQLVVVPNTYIYGRKYVQILGLKFHYGKVRRYKDDGTFARPVVDGKERHRNAYNRQNNL